MHRVLAVHSNIYLTTSLQSPSMVKRKYSSGGRFLHSSSTDCSSPSSAWRFSLGFINPSPVKTHTHSDYFQLYRNVSPCFYDCVRIDDVHTTCRHSRYSRCCTMLYNRGSVKTHHEWRTECMRLSHVSTRFLGTRINKRTHAIVREIFILFLSIMRTTIQYSNRRGSTTRRLITISLVHGR